jgi:hypoxanthine phosphoribosyltransferase
MPLKKQTEKQSVAPGTVIIREQEFDLLISPENIREKVMELAKNLNRKYKNVVPILIPVLTGSFVFTADLIPLLEFRYDINFIKISSYGNNTVSSKNPQEILGLTMSLENRNTIVLEDIIDSGLTLDYVIEQLKRAGAASIEVATLLFKKENWKGQYLPDWVGFEIGPEFVIGYGMDYGEQGRSLRAIYQIRSKS